MEEYRYHLFGKYEGGAGSENLTHILFKHFSLKGKSGGGDCQVIQISSDLFCVSFKSEQVRDRVLAQDQKVATTNSEVALTLGLSLQAKNAPERKEDSLPLPVNPEEISIAACEVCTAQIQIPSESVYSDLLEPHYLKSIQEDFTDVKFQFDVRTLTLQINGTPQSVSSAKSDVYDALRRLKSKEINMAPALTTYLKSRGSGLVSKINFLPEEIAATIDVRSDSSVVIHGLSHHDIKRAEKILIEDLATKEMKIHEEEAASVVNTNSFEDFVEELNKTYTGVQVSVVDSNDNKPVCMVAGRKTNLSSVEEKIHEFIHEQSKMTLHLKLDGDMELTESLPLLLDKLELSHLSGRVRWNLDLKTLELTGTQKENDENMASIKEKTKGLQCKTVTICQPGAYSYFKANGQEFLNSLDSMLSCMAVLVTEPGKLHLQAMSLVERNAAGKGKGSGVLFHGDDKDMCLIADNVIVQATVSDKLTELSDVIINPLCRSTTGGKILNAAGLRVKTELTRTVRRSAITLTGPGDLPCRLIVHIPCLCGPRAKEYLQDAIRECQKRNFKSIAVFLDINELHQNFDKHKLAMDFIVTAMENMDAEEGMSVVLAQKSFFQCFKKAAESFYNEMHMLSNMELLFFHVTPFGISGCLNTSSKSKDDLESLHRHSALCEPAVIHVFSKQCRLLDKAKAAIEKHYAGFLSTDMLINPFLRICGDQTLAKIRQLQEKHGVNVIIGDGTVIFNGLAVKTSIVREEAFELLKAAADLKQLEQKREVLRNIQWVINDEEVDPVNLSCENNYDVEVQYMCLHEPIEVTYDDKTFTVNVSDMTAINKETSQVHPVLRTELIVENYPGKWSVTEEKFKKVELEIDSLEYLLVERRFNETLSSKIINKIERVENRNLWKRFSLDLTGEVKLLFHGLKHADVGQVEKNGFFRPPETFFSSETAHGRGIYFYVDASSAQKRCEADAQGQRVMFLGRVETGIFNVGRKGINSPPPVDPSDPGVLYHSVVDNKRNPSVFVVFSSDKTYPEYCITFSDAS